MKVYFKKASGLLYSARIPDPTLVPGSVTSLTLKLYDFCLKRSGAVVLMLWTFLVTLMETGTEALEGPLVARIRRLYLLTSL